MLQCVAECYSVLQGVAVCCSVLQCAAVCCALIHRRARTSTFEFNDWTHPSRQQVAHLHAVAPHLLAQVREHKTRRPLLLTLRSQRALTHRRDVEESKGIRFVGCCSAWCSGCCVCVIV